MKMLSGLCKNKFYDVFEKRCQDLQKLEVFNGRYDTPLQFAQQLSDLLLNDDIENKNVVHHMVMLLLESDLPVSNFFIYLQNFFDANTLELKSTGIFEAVTSLYLLFSY